MQKMYVLGSLNKTENFLVCRVLSIRSYKIDKFLDRDPSYVDAAFSLEKMSTLCTK